jgi:serine phosphatase RsbU (regulator of sigma subunit)/pSer/pThr/pTyr-binding forkhead associated (FHA) protein
MPWLVGTTGALAGRRFSLDAPCLVGRGPYNHVVLDDTRISRQHAKISPESGGHVLYDLNSANGTFVNDVQVRRQRLAPNDLVRFGPFGFKFEGELVDEHPGRGARVEEQTRPGFEAPSKILNSLDASSAIVPPQSLALGGLSALEDADRKLRTLYAFMHAISTTLDTSELIERILSNVLAIFPDADTVGVYLRDGGTGRIEPRGVLRRDGRAAPSLALAPQIHDEVVRKGRAILSAPLTFAWQEDAPPPGGLSMHAPMMYRDVAHGVLHARTADGAPARFTQGDLDLLTAIAAQAAMALSNARLHQESLRQQRLEQDLVLAEQIQKSFLPRTLPRVPGIEFATEYRPAYSVGGDFYDVFWMTPERIGVVIGDVSGKGVSAALLMARVSSDLRAAALAEQGPARALARVNRAVIERRQLDIFVTAIFLTLDVRTRAVVLANAGHLPPLIRRGRRGALERVDRGTGTAIGIFDDATFEQTELALEVGDTMVLCTDGVLEASDAHGVQFGFERLEQSLGAGTSARPAEIAERLQRDLRAHVGDASQYDDLTLIVCGVSDAARASDRPPPAPSSRRPFLEETMRPPR